jgi:adenylyltransferase/sulfurtransferase
MLRLPIAQDGITPRLMQEEPRQLEDRYARHRLIDGWDQDRLAAARVIVVGAGAIGNEVIKLLAMMGFGHILIVDFDLIEITNLTRSALFREEDIGRPKALVAAERAREINPHISVAALQGDLRFNLGLGVIRSTDLVIGCLDSLDARLALNRACLRAGTPWLNGGIEVTVAEVSLFGPEAGACFECGMSPEMWERRGSRFSCTGLQTNLPDAKMPTTAVMASLAAAYLAQEALCLLHSNGGPEKEGLSFSEKITVSVKPYETRTYTLQRNPECLAHEVCGPICMRTESAADTSALDMLAWAGCPNGVVELGFDLIVELVCVECSHREPYVRPLDSGDETLLYCAKCRRDSRHPETLSWLDAEHPLSRVPLAELCIPDHAVLAVKENDDRTYFQLGGQP